MGMTFATLYLWGIGREALLPRLEPGDLLREQNAPWLGVVPDEEACGDLGRLEKLGKLLTKENGSAAALLFYYYDDDWFLCRLYQGGKKTAEGRGEGSWAKLGKKLNELFGDEAPAKALRYLSHCSDLQEQIALLEETVGAALYDVSVEEQPRRVPRSDTTLREIKARESALRRRPKQFKFTELPREDWPEILRESWDMGELDRARYPYGLGFPVYGPYHPGALFGSPPIGYTSGNREEQQSRFAVFDSGIGQFREWGPFSLPPVRLLWKTKRGELVLLFHRLLTVSNGERSWVVVSGTGSVRCVLPDGSERWSFEPELGERNLTYAHSSQEGILTLYAVQETRNAISSAAQIWRMDGETGEILCSRKLPETERLKTMAKKRNWCCWTPACGKLPAGEASADMINSRICRSAAFSSGSSSIGIRDRLTSMIFGTARGEIFRWRSPFGCERSFRTDGSWARTRREARSRCSTGRERWPPASPCREPCAPYRRRQNGSAWTCRNSRGRWAWRLDRILSGAWIRSNNQEAVLSKIPMRLAAHRDA